MTLVLHSRPIMLENISRSDFDLLPPPMNLMFILAFVDGSIGMRTKLKRLSGIDRTIRLSEAKN